MLCRYCGKEKPSTDFYESQQHKRCKVCWRSYTTARRRKDPVHARNYVDASAFVEKNENKALILTPYTEPSSSLTIMVEDRT